MTIDLKSRKTWIILALATVLLFLFFRTCSPVVNGRAITRTVDSLQSQNSALSKRLAIVSEAYYKANSDLKIKMDSLEDQKKISDNQAAYWKFRLLSSVGAVTKAKTGHDTAWIIESCDSVIEAAIQVQNVADHYRQITDSMVAVHRDQVQIKDELISQYESAIVEKDSTISQMAAIADNAAKEARRQNRKLRFNQGLNKILAGSLVVAIIIISL